MSPRLRTGRRLLARCLLTWWGLILIQAADYAVSNPRARGFTITLRIRRRFGALVITTGLLGGFDIFDWHGGGADCPF